MKRIEIPRFFFLSRDFLKESIHFLAMLTNSSSCKIALNFSKINGTSQSAITVLIAQIEKSVLIKNNEIYREGAMPTSKIIKDMFVNMGDVFHVNQKISLHSNNDLENAQTVPPELISSVVKNLKKIGLKEYFYPFNTFLTELIGNAAEHGIENKNINWWMKHEVDRSKRTAIYTFVDMGSGIINSHKKAGLSWKYFFLGNKRIVLDALYGKLGSSTKKKNRGRGLPQLRGIIEKDWISNLVIITNTVNLSYEKGKFIAGRNPDFIGTYFSWTITEKNYEKWKSSQST